MKEIDQINKNTNGQTPKGRKTRIHVSGVSNASEVLENCKKIVIGFLMNQSLDRTSEQWRIIFPGKVVSFLDGLTQEDRAKDEYFYPLASHIYDLQHHKDWEWYSSKKINGKEFEITVKGSFYPHFLWIIHAQKVPLSAISIDDDQFGSYKPQAYVDITLD